MKNIVLVSNEMKENQIPFPQADSLDKVIEVCNFLSKGSVYPGEVANHMNFTKRQAYLYLNAGMYLNLIQKENKEYELTNQGKIFNNKTFVKRNEMLLFLFLENEMLEQILLNYLFNKKMIDKGTLIDNYILEYNNTTKEYSNSTLNRRAQTILRWLEYILPTVKSVLVDKKALIA